LPKDLGGSPQAGVPESVISMQRNGFQAIWE